MAATDQAGDARGDGVGTKRHGTAGTQTHKLDSGDPGKDLVRKNGSGNHLHRILAVTSVDPVTGKEGAVGDGNEVVARSPHEAQRALHLPPLHQRAASVASHHRRDPGGKGSGPKGHCGRSRQTQKLHPGNPPKIPVGKRRVRPDGERVHSLASRQQVAGKIGRVGKRDKSPSISPR